MQCLAHDYQQSEQRHARLPARRPPRQRQPHYRWNGNIASSQEYKPWGEVRSGAVPQTDLNYTGERKDGTGLLYYGARYYNPALGRFISADTIVPGMAMGAGGALGSVGTDSASSIKGLTVAYQETSFAAAVAGENQLTFSKGFYFQLSSRDRQQAKAPYGPLNPQALNRYSYVLNNPLRHTDPTGHTWYLSHEDAHTLSQALYNIAQEFYNGAQVTWSDAAAFVPSGSALGGIFVDMLKGLLNMLVGKASNLAIADILGQLSIDINTSNGVDGVAMRNTDNGILLMDRSNGKIIKWDAGLWWGIIKGNLSESLNYGAKPVYSKNGKKWWNTWHFYEPDYWYWDDNPDDCAKCQH